MDVCICLIKIDISESNVATAKWKIASNLSRNAHNLLFMIIYTHTTISLFQCFKQTSLISLQYQVQIFSIKRNMIVCVWANLYFLLSAFNEIWNLILCFTMNSLRISHYYTREKTSAGDSNSNSSSYCYTYKIKIHWSL